VRGHERYDTFGHAGGTLLHQGLYLRQHRGDARIARRDAGLLQPGGECRA
jgi:hypothetical protein